MLFNEFAITTIAFTIGLAIFSVDRVPDMTRRTFMVFAAIVFGLTAINLIIVNVAVSYVAGLAIALFMRRGKVGAVPVYFLLLFLIPSINHDIGIKGVMNKIITLNWLKFLTLSFAAIGLTLPRRPMDQSDRDIKIVEWPIILYCLYYISLELYRYGITSGIRGLTVVLPELYLPFWIATRLLKTSLQIRQVMWAGLIVWTAMAVLGIFEAVFHWHPYTKLARAFGSIEGEFTYLGRDGVLRAYAIFGMSLIFGPILAIAVSFWAYLYSGRKTIVRYGVFLMLLGGLYASGARGSWIAVALGLFLYLSLTLGTVRASIRYATGGFALVMLAIIGGAYERILALLPFVGDRESGSVSYRIELLETGIASIKKFPLFGRSDFLMDPDFEKLIQGQGIIDVVNSYLGVALEYGLIGLVLFTLPIALVGLRLLLRARKLRKIDADEQKLTAALLSALFMLSMILFTTSALSHLPYMLSFLMGLGCAQLASSRRLIQTYQSQSVQT